MAYPCVAHRLAVATENVMIITRPPSPQTPARVPQACQMSQERQSRNFNKQNSCQSTCEILLTVPLYPGQATSNRQQLVPAIATGSPVVIGATETRKHKTYRQSHVAVDAPLCKYARNRSFPAPTGVVNTEKLSPLMLMTNTVN